MQISVDLHKTSAVQRAALIKFITEYPVHSAQLGIEVDIDTTKAQAGIAALQNAVDPATAFSKTPAAPVPAETVIRPDLAPVPAETVIRPDLAPGAVELDKNGLPWDARIHSGNREKIANGTWRKRRGVADDLVATVEAELRAVMGAPAAQPVAAQVAPQAPPPPPADPLAIPANLRRVPEAPQPAAAPPAPAAPDAMGQYVQLVGRASAAIGAKKITQEQIAGVCAHYGVQSLPMLANRLDLLAVIAESIDALIAAAG